MLGPGVIASVFRAREDLDHERAPTHQLLDLLAVAGSRQAALLQVLPRERLERSLSVQPEPPGRLALSSVLGRPLLANRRLVQK